jgi:Protein of unknown function (DUF2867)
MGGLEGGTTYADERCHEAGAPAGVLWRVIEGIGGDRGWHTVPGAWELRGGLDRLVGGVGMRRGRRDPDHVRVGDPVDFWRVERVEPGRLLRLRAEMRLPGRAWLEMRAEDAAAGRSVYRQRVEFVPRGLAGHAYWVSSVPFHPLVFGVMARNIARSAGRGAGQPVTYG